MAAKPDPKIKILNAAARVVERLGAAHLTIDAVAAESSFSKGGVLYHYPNKRALIQGMLQFVISEISERAARHQQAAQPEVTNATVHSLILADQEQNPSERAMALAILAAAAEDPSLLEPARAEIAQWFNHAQQEGRVGTILLLANEGLRFLDMLNLLPTTSTERAAIHQQLLSIASEDRL